MAMQRRTVLRAGLGAAVLRAQAATMLRCVPYAGLSLTQWLALAPPELVRAHLNVDEAFIQALHKDKRPVVG